jgi:hypothetical protein
MTFGDIFSEINLDSSIIYVIILANLIFLASKLGVLTLNIIENDTHAIMNDIVYIDHMKIADVSASPSYICK